MGVPESSRSGFSREERWTAKRDISAISGSTLGSPVASRSRKTKVSARGGLDMVMFVLTGTARPKAARARGINLRAREMGMPMSCYPQPSHWPEL
jgi:hypothetical protein